MQMVDSFKFSHSVVFQNAIASHESNGLDIIISLILNDISPLGQQHMDLVLELKVVFLKFSILCFINMILTVLFQLTIAF